MKYIKVGVYLFGILLIVGISLIWPPNKPLTFKQYGGVSYTLPQFEEISITGGDFEIRETGGSGHLEKIGPDRFVASNGTVTVLVISDNYVSVTIGSDVQALTGTRIVIATFFWTFIFVMLFLSRDPA